MGEFRQRSSVPSGLKLSLLVLSAFVILGSFCLADYPPRTITTLDNRVYKNAVITSVSENEISFTYDDGVMTIPRSNLPDEIINELGMNDAENHRIAEQAKADAAEKQQVEEKAKADFDRQQRQAEADAAERQRMAEQVEAERQSQIKEQQDEANLERADKQEQAAQDARDKEKQDSDAMWVIISAIAIPLVIALMVWKSNPNPAVIAMLQRNQIRSELHDLNQTIHDIKKPNDWN